MSTAYAATTAPYNAPYASYDGDDLTPTSIFSTICTSVKSAITALGLPASVIIRKQPIVGIDDDLPIIFVTPEAEKPVQEDNRGIAIIDYPVLVTFAMVGNQLIETNVTGLLNWRELIRFTLNKPLLTGAPSVIGCSIELNPPFEFPRYKAELDASAIRFTFRSSESWNKTY